MANHAGYGRYDVEVNGQVVGRAVKRPEGWEATGAMPGVSVTVHGHDSLESACMAIGRALMGAEVRYELGRPRWDRVAVQAARDFRARFPEAAASWDELMKQEATG